MTVRATHPRRDEQILGWLLAAGTSVGCALIALGLLAGPVGSTGGNVLHNSLGRVGIGVFVLLPTARVILMLVLFLRKREYLLAAAAWVVFVIIALGCFLGALS
jgi:hypothetical protein